MDHISQTSNASAQKLLLLGVGQVAKAIARIWRKKKLSTIYGTTRNQDRKNELEGLGVHPLVGDLSTKNWDQGGGTEASADPVSFRQIIADSYTVVSFPPDGLSDQAIAKYFGASSKLVYISSTGVYGSRTGYIDENTPVDLENPSVKVRIEAEKAWQAYGAIVLRAPGIYGSDGGILERLLRGTYQMPEDKNLISSRIHVEDLARIAVKALECGKPGTTYVIGDEQPCSQQEVALWLCSQLNLATPPTVPTDLLPPTARSNRHVNGKRVLEELKLSLNYPSYKVGYSAVIEQKGLTL